MTFPAPTHDAAGPAPGDGPVPQGGEPEALLSLPEQRLTQARQRLAAMQQLLRRKDRP